MHKAWSSRNSYNYTLPDESNFHFIITLQIIVCTFLVWLFCVYDLGSGTVLFFDSTPAGLVPIQSFNWVDGLFDVAWSESNDNIAVTAGGDGCLHVWDVNRPQVHSQMRLLLFLTHWRPEFA